MKLISETAEYGLRIILWMAYAGEPQTTGVIARGTRIPEDYLSKVLQRLTRSGLLEGRRGRGGGFRLKKDPKELTVLDVVEAVDPVERIQACPLGLKQHGRCLCPLHAGLNAASDSLRRTLASQRLTAFLQPGAKSVPLGLDLSKQNRSTD